MEFRDRLSFSSVEVAEGTYSAGKNNPYRFLRPPWTEAPPESKELLAFCLKKIKGLAVSNVNDP